MSHSVLARDAELSAATSRSPLYEASSHPCHLQEVHNPRLSGPGGSLHDAFLISDGECDGDDGRSDEAEEPPTPPRNKAHLHSSTAKKDGNATPSAKKPASEPDSSLQCTGISCQEGLGCPRHPTFSSWYQRARVRTSGDTKHNTRHSQSDPPKAEQEPPVATIGASCEPGPASIPDAVTNNKTTRTLPIEARVQHSPNSARLLTPDPRPVSGTYRDELTSRQRSNSARSQVNPHYYLSGRRHDGTGAMERMPRLEGGEEQDQEDDDDISLRPRKRKKMMSLDADTISGCESNSNGEAELAPPRPGQRTIAIDRQQRNVDKYISSPSEGSDSERDISSPQPKRRKLHSTPTSSSHNSTRLRQTAINPAINIDESRGERSAQGCKPLPDDWRSTQPGRAYIAATQVRDNKSAPLPSDKELSHFPGQPITKDSGGTLRPDQWRHIRTTYAFARYLLDEEAYNQISEACRMPLGYIRQLLWHTGDFENETAIALDAVMEKARSDYDVLPTFPGIPLTDCSGSLSLTQFKHLEETYQHLVTEIDQMSDDENYKYLLAIWEQLIYDHQGWDGRRY